jgi:hypothetical protein
MGNRPVSPLPVDGTRKPSLRQKFEVLYARRFSKAEEESTIIPRRIPSPGEEIDQWMESIKVMTRLKGGIPRDLRKKVRHAVTASFVFVLCIGVILSKPVNRELMSPVPRIPVFLS